MATQSLFSLKANDSNIAKMNSMLEANKKKASSNAALYTKNPSYTSNRGSTSGKTTTVPITSAVSPIVADTSLTGIADQLKALQEQQAQSYSNAYGVNRDAVNSLYSNAMENANNLYGQQQSALQQALSLQKQGIQSEAEKALQNAYISKMNTEKNLEQQLTAQGLSGGASESSKASLLNQYGNNRNSIENAKLSDVASAESSYNTNLASLLSGLQQAQSSAENTRFSNLAGIENTLASATAGTYNNLYDGISSLNTARLAALSARAKATASANTSSSKDITKYADVTKQLAASNPKSPNITASILKVQYGLSDANIATLLNYYY